ncbi:MAG: nucleotidyltransferase family protein [Bacillati bacterium ANGP1]|uniref:Nucleotidyltransferase family protein n=1 Tax=Candidatus Segetimicrobium genomatis TaxID=2569760 RepID=A0A537JP02_9BACT|nr:MAG: nucleotidyltransferase family protein [Terrabacteria group bacterium ANGP1]
MPGDGAVPHHPRDRPVRAMILAAGLGTRLRPLTDHTPKCMVPLGGKPLLEHGILWLRKHGITELVINLHHLPDVVTGYFGDGGRWGVRITYSHEPQVLGTAGGVKNVEGLFRGPFFVWYGDNLSTCRLDRLWERHDAHGGVATIALHYREDPAHSGIVAEDDQGRIVRFLEKPRPGEVFSHWVNAGIYVLEPAVLDAIPGGRAVDFAHEVFPGLLAAGRPVYGYRMAEDEHLWWIDGPDDLRRVEHLWREIAGSGV